MSSITDTAARVVTVAGSIAIAYLTAHQATKAARVNKEAVVKRQEAANRGDLETAAYQRAESYLTNVLADARRELDDEKRERRSEVAALTRSLAAERAQREQEVAGLSRRLARAEERADRAEATAKALARRLGEAAPEF